MCIVLMLLVTSFGLMLSVVSSRSDGVHDQRLDNIGDVLRSSSLVTIDSSVSSVTITLIDPDYVTADVYLSDTKPSEDIEYLLPVTLRASTFSNTFNYLGYDEPIYLLPGSKLIYNISVSSVFRTSKCPVRLHLYNNWLDYTISSEAIATTPCLSVGFNTIWIFNITESSTYYVGIETGNETIVTSNVSVVRVYYNSTVLESPSDCSSPLTNNNSVCTVTTCDNVCNKPDVYILVKPNSNVNISYDLSPFNHNQIYFANMVLLSVISTRLCFCILLLFFCTIWYRLHKRKIAYRKLHNYKYRRNITNLSYMDRLNSNHSMQMEDYSVHSSLLHSINDHPINSYHSFSIDDDDPINSSHFTDHSHSINLTIPSKS